MSENIGMFSIYDESFISEYKNLTDKVHEKGGRYYSAACHLGSGTLMKNVRVLVPSAVENSMTKTIPEEMTPDDIKRFVKAANRTKFAEAGALAIEVSGPWMNYKQKTLYFASC